MKNQRKVIVYVAQSLDGYIARVDGRIDWLSAVEKSGEDYGYAAFMNQVDTVFMGRKTYEQVLGFGIEFPHKNKECYVLSRSLIGKDKHVHYVQGNLAPFLHSLKEKPGGNIFVDGGAETIDLFRRLGLIDEYVISILPVLLGSGLPLFQSGDLEEELILMEAKSFSTGLVQLHYRCKPKTL